MKILEDILNSAPKPRLIEAVSVPEISDEKMYLAQLHSDERDSMELDWQDRKTNLGSKGEGFRAFCVAYCLCGTDGTLLCNRENIDQVATALGSKPAPAISRAFGVASKLNGITEEDQKALEAEAEKN